MREIRALVCRVGSEPVVEEIEDTLESWQALVDGLIEVVPLGDGVLLVCNDDGVDTKPFNRSVPGLAPRLPDGFDFIVIPADAAPPGTIGAHYVYGDFALVRQDDHGNFASLSDDDIVRYSAALPVPIERETT